MRLQVSTSVRNAYSEMPNVPAACFSARVSRFCQAMEPEYEKLAKELNIPVAKFRGDEQRDYVQANLNTETFPTVNVITKDGNVVKYDSEARTVADFKAFVEKTTA